MNDLLFHKPCISCPDCIANGFFWDKYLSGLSSDSELLSAYYSHDIDIECLLKEDKLCVMNSNQGALILTAALQKYTINQIIDIIQSNNYFLPISATNIPQFSSVDNCIFKVGEILHGSMLKSMTYAEMGKYLRKGVGYKKLGADTKYGENHSKMAALIDLCDIKKKSCDISCSSLGLVLLNYNQDVRKRIATKLFLKIPIIQKYFVYCYDEKQLLDMLLTVLSESTAKRRFPNVKRVILMINKQRDDEIF